MKVGFQHLQHTTRSGSVIPAHTHAAGPAVEPAATPGRSAPSGTRRAARAWVALGALLAVSAAGALAAQGPSTAPLGQLNSPIPVPIPDGGFRRPDLEQQAGVMSGDSEQIYRWDAPMETMVNYYIQRLRGDRDRPLDTATVRRGMATSITYHMTFWSFEDQCADSAAAAAGAATPTCRHWLRGKDLNQVIKRRADWAPGLWVKDVMFTWYSRDQQGVLTRWTADVVDSGISKDWRTYEPTTDLVFKRTEFKSGATAAPAP